MNCQVHIYNGGENVRPRKFVLAVTTYNRVRYLKQMIESWMRTRSKDVEWSLMVADDGSTDGTLEYMAALLPGCDTLLLQHDRRGVHVQTNNLLRQLEDSEYDLCFKVDDDILFLAEGWDLEYYAACKRTGYDHLIFFNQELYSRKIDKRVSKDGLVSLTSIHKVLGCFFTITPEVIKHVGYFDVLNFGLAVYGHIDFSWRCCRAGFNSAETPFDIEGSNRWISNQNLGYRPAVRPSVRKRHEASPEVLKKKKRVMRNNARTYVPFRIISRHYRENQKKPFLLTGCPRSGAKYAANYLTALGISLAEDHHDSDGQVSWMAVASTPDGLGVYDVFEKVIHLTRNPLPVLCSLLTLNDDSLSFISKHANIATGCSMRQAMSIWLRWTSMIDALNPLRIQVEKLDMQIDTICQYLDLPSPNFVPEVEIVTKSRRHWRKYTQLSWDMLIKADEAMAYEIISRGNEYGYCCECSSSPMDVGC